MRTLIVLCALLSVASAALGQSEAARKSILEGELAAEAAGYADAYAELKSARNRDTPADRLEDIAERVNRHRRNLAELAREIARTEGDVAVNGARPKALPEDNWLVPANQRADESLPTGPARPAHPDWLVPGDQEMKSR